MLIFELIWVEKYVQRILINIFIHCVIRKLLRYTSVEIIVKLLNDTRNYEQIYNETEVEVFLFDYHSEIFYSEILIKVCRS